MSSTVHRPAVEFPRGLIASSESIRKYSNDGVVDHPKGTGLYKLVERVRDQSVESSVSTAIREPSLDHIIFRLIQDGNARVAAL